MVRRAQRILRVGELRLIVLPPDFMAEDYVFIESRGDELIVKTARGSWK